MVFARILQEVMKENNILNIRHLVDKSFVPANQRIILQIVKFLYLTTLYAAVIAWVDKAHH